MVLVVCVYSWWVLYVRLCVRRVGFVHTWRRFCVYRPGLCVQAMLGVVVRVRVDFRWPVGVLERVDAVRGGVSRTDFVLGAVEERLLGLGSGGVVGERSSREREVVVESARPLGKGVFTPRPKRSSR